MSMSIRGRFHHFRAPAFVACLAGLIGTTQAATVDANYGQLGNQAYVQGGTQSLSFSSDMLNFLDTGKIQVAPYSGAAVTSQKDADGFYTQINTQTILVSLQTSDNTANIVGINTTGGLTLTAPFLKNISTSGMLTLSDWHIDTQTREVSTTVIGANGVGTRQPQALWQASDIQTSLVNKGHWDGNLDFYDYTVTLTGLGLTDYGRTTFIQALGLQALGTGALDSVSEQGTLTTKITFLAAPGFSPAVPEPATWVTLCMGLVGLVAVARRSRSKHPCSH